MKNSARTASESFSSTAFWLRAGMLLLVLSALLLSGARAFAAVPAAGTSIGNAASATYDDGSGVRIVTSNTVTTVVAQVASFTLTASQSKPGAAGTTVYFPHTLTNTGNGTDTFDLSATDVTSGTFNFTSVTLYSDANGDGVPDTLTPVTSTGPLGAGTQFKFVAAGVVPGSATNAQTDTITVNAVGNAAAATAGGYTAAGAQTNSDVVTVTGNAVIDVTKAISAPNGVSPSGPYTITLTYRNNGFATATAVTLTDALPTGMTYVANSGRWSGSGATVLTDAAGGDPSGIDYTGAATVSAVVTSVAPGVNGTVTFQVNIAAGVAPSTLNNTATYQYNNGAAVVGPFNSNTAAFTVLQTAGVDATDAASTTDADGANGTVRVNTAPQGSTVAFDNSIVNTGNGTDSFDITMSGSTFPAGTTFLLYKSDNATPLVDTNGNGTPDTGPVAPGATYHVFVKAVLPAGASGPGPYNVTKTARSFFNPAQVDTVTDQLGAITSNAVDLTNNTPLPGAPGAGPGNATPVITNTVAPGATTTFVLVANNTGPAADNYDLSATSTLPSGWTLVFKADGGAGNCSTTGANITNTGSINAGASSVVCAQITVPANAAAGNTDITFRALSPSSGAQDTIVDRVTVSSVRNVTITPNGAGQVAPGSIVVYQHTVTNGGNVQEAITFPAPFLVDTLAASNWQSTAYIDTNNNGVIDLGTDTVINNLTSFNLNPGQSQPILVRVTAPSTASTGQVNQTTLQATATNTSGAPVGQPISAVDTTTVITGQLTLQKRQALDANCDGTADTAFSSANITSGAVPGACIRYEITASNTGTAPVSSVVINDSTPTNTVYDNGSRNSTGGACGTGAADAAAQTSVGTITAPACGSAGSVSATVGTLNPLQSVVVTFGVFINNN